MLDAMFITFEGPEGSGKTSQIRLLTAYLQQEGYPVLATREPGGTRIGDQIRACLHDVANKEMTAVTEMLLYAASRAQLVRELKSEVENLREFLETKNILNGPFPKDMLDAFDEDGDSGFDIIKRIFEGISPSKRAHKKKKK